MSEVNESLEGQMPPGNDLGSLRQSLIQGLYSLRAEPDSLLRELLSRRPPLFGGLYLEPVNVDTHSQDGEIYLTVRYRFQGRFGADDSPSCSK